MVADDDSTKRNPLPPTVLTIHFSNEPRAAQPVTTHYLDWNRKPHSSPDMARQGNELVRLKEAVATLAEEINTAENTRPANKGGRPPKYNWPLIVELATRRLLKHYNDDDMPALADLISAVCEEYKQTGGDPPDADKNGKELRVYIGAVLAGFTSP